MRYLTSIVLLASMAFAFPAKLSAQDVRGQGVSGQVVGIDQKPTGATVTVLDQQQRVMGQVVVAPDGSFAYETGAAIGSIVVRQEAVTVTRGVVGGADHGIEIDLRTSVRWTQSLVILDPAGTPAVGLDVIVQDTKGKTISCVTTGAEGWLHVRGNQPVTSLLLDPLGWQHAVAVEFGPRKTPRETIPDMTIDMRPHANKFVLLQGSIVDLAGKPVGDARIIASKKQSGMVTPCGVTKAKSDGTFRLWTTREATRLAATSGGTSWERDGDWSDGGVQVVRLDERKDGMVMVMGVVKDKDGKAVDDAIIYVSQIRTLVKGARGVTGTGRSGYFRLSVRRATPFLIADLRDGRGLATKAGPWPESIIVLQAKN